MYILLPVAAVYSLTDKFCLTKNNYRMRCNQIHINLPVPTLDTLAKG